jgi:uncharacterized protein (TIGR02145 family)
VTGTASGSSFTIKGTPSATGTFGYTLTATVSGCTNSTSGTISVAAAPSGAASTQAWTIGTRGWSAPLKKAQTGCTQTTDFFSTNPPEVAYYRSSGLYSGSGYLYNGKCVSDYATQLCPSPWRVPTASDLSALAIELGGSGSGQYNLSAGMIQARFGDTWGGVFAGAAIGPDIVEQGTRMNVWGYSGSTSETDVALQLRLTNETVCPHCVSLRSSGYQVRCVR